MRLETILSALLGALLALAALAHGAHDLWAATAVYFAIWRREQHL